MTTPHVEPSTAEGDPRPRFAIGHVALPVRDVGTATEFFTAIGMREVIENRQMSIVELRGGTHMILRPSDDAGSGSLDLMVDDIHETHALLAEAGADPTPIDRGSPHDSFTASDPDGNALVVRSSHVIGPV